MEAWQRDDTQDLPPCKQHRPQAHPPAASIACLHLQTCPSLTPPPGALPTVTLRDCSCAHSCDVRMGMTTTPTAIINTTTIFPETQAAVGSRQQWCGEQGSVAAGARG